MKSSDCYVEIAIFFKDSTRDYISPIVDTDEDISISEGYIHIHNDCYTYSYDINSIVSIIANRILNYEIIESEILYRFDE